MNSKIQNTKIIVGLGNPGEQYKYTRHNFGFLAIDELARLLGLSWHKHKKFKAKITKDKDVILIKPLTFINKSGEVLEAILSYYKLLPKKLGLIKKRGCDLSQFLTVIHDDLDINFGKYKISINSRSAGHKGVQSIINHLKTKNFYRVRFGIKPPLDNKIPIEKFVLQKFNKEELKIVNQVIADWLQEQYK